MKVITEGVVRTKFDIYVFIVVTYDLYFYTWKVTLTGN
jgi:hypothetical protein